jgi:hypothetical protein
MTTLAVAQYYSQVDSATGMGYRMCFSSSCAMGLKFLLPGSLRGSNADDDYLRRVLMYGDTTDAGAQVQALRYFGVDAHFHTDGNRHLLEQEIKEGYPVATGILHHGNVHAPSGGGHWMLCIGVEQNVAVFHDPYGEMDAVNGGYAQVGAGGKGASYTWQNWLPRWEANGADTGWCVTFRRRA